MQGTVKPAGEGAPSHEPRRSCHRARVPRDAPLGSALLGPEDDAGSGGDAGDGFADALPIAPGTYQGNVSQLGDLDDFYTVDLPLGAWATFLVRAKIAAACIGEVGCPVLSDCPVIRLYAPDQRLRESGGCGSWGDDYQSLIYFFLADMPGAWYVRVSAGTPRSELPEQPYTLEVRLRAVHGSFLRYSFEDVHAAAVRLGPALGAYHALFMTDTIPLVEGTAAPDFMAMAFAPGRPEAYGFAVTAGDMWSIRPVLAAHALGASMAVRVEPPGVARPNKAGFLVESEGGESSAFVTTLTASRPFSATLLLSYDGDADVGFWKDLEGERVVAATLSEFEADMRLQTPLGGIVGDAELRRSLGTYFAGFYRLSSLDSILDDRAGGYVDPAGNRVQLESPDHPWSLAWLVQPLSGEWTFWLDHERGLQGDPRLLFGVDLPEDFVNPEGSSSPAA